MTASLRERLPADMLYVVLVRHGRTAWNVERRFLGRTDLPLDEVGLDEVAQLAAASRGAFDRIYASPLLRAIQTARALAPPDPVVVPDVQEIGHGELEGLTRDEALARHAPFFAAFAEDPTAVRVPGGESFGEVRDRAWAALHGIARAHRRGERVAVVTHQVVASTVLCTVDGAPLRDWRRYALPNAGSAVLAWDGERFVRVRG